MSEKTLYCIAYTYWSLKDRKWKAAKVYTHAKDAGEARLIYFRSENPRTHHRINITGVAPVVGYFVNDNHGEMLSAD